MLKKKGKLKTSLKLFYAVGQCSDSLGFNFYYFFFLFFLTDFVGINPAAAGTISLIAIIWDAFTDPVAGHITDHLHTKYGRKRPMMIVGIIPYGICAFLIFHFVDLGGSAVVAYYTVLAIIFWTSYKTYVIPYNALGAELTDDFNERTSLRSYASVCVYGAAMLASTIPPIAIDKLGAKGIDPVGGWGIVSALFGIVIIICGVICWNATRGKEAKMEDIEIKKENFFKSYIEILKLKPGNRLAVTVAALSFCTTIISSGVVYLMANVLHLTASLQSIALATLTIMGIVFIPVVTTISNKKDKKFSMILSLAISAATWIICGLVGIHSFMAIMVFIICGQIGMTAFWTLYFSMMYDISELDEFVNGYRREGTITALMSFAQKLGAAVATWFLGQMLAISGYDAALNVQCDAANNMILYINTLIPGAVGIIGIIALITYPLTSERFNALITALKAKREGKEYSTEGFEKTL